MSVLHFTDTSFKDEVLSSSLPVMVDFWAPWCGPCKMIAPIVDELAAEYKEKMKIGKINIDEDQRVAGQMGVMSIPTIIFFKNGKAIEQVVGALSKQELKKKIEANL
ncbi:MAG: thioredoxin [Candidatus Omnitrophica bacterium]|jgi:thioredoxin 1|nr:thioredoxin [Candidatus Omnitrophota bacterium]